MRSAIPFCIYHIGLNTPFMAAAILELAIMEGGYILKDTSEKTQLRRMGLIKKLNSECLQILLYLK
jgi:hypothetical protein